MRRLICLYGGIVLLFNVSCKENVPAIADTFNPQIRLNQIGYYPDAVKKAVVVTELENGKCGY